MHTPNCPCLPDNELPIAVAKSTQPVESAQPSFDPRSVLSHLWQGFLRWVYTSDEPKVTQRFNRQGQSTGWQVFDPQTGHTIPFGSELEIRLWLEQRYR